MSFTLSHYSSLYRFGLGKEREFFIENLSMLITGGMPITGVFDAIASEARSRRMKSIIADLKLDIESGSSLWQALQRTRLFPTHSISLIRLGEESGKLIENLKVVAIEQEKDRMFRSKLQSAMMYPIFVLLLTAVIGVGIAWFILPKLAIVFSQLKIKLPLITKILIGIGAFLGQYGAIAIPAFIVGIVVIFSFFFVFSKTKFIGQFILFSVPGIHGLMKEVEISRCGFLLGTLLGAGLPITHALDSLANATEVHRYKRLYLHLSRLVGEGYSLQKSFAAFKHIDKLVPSSIQHLIVAGEQSGTLAASLVRIGQTFEVKADTTTKNLTVILEPILLVIVWLGVVTVALAVVLPIYSLIGGFNAGGGDTSGPALQVQPVVPITISAVSTTSSTVDVAIATSSVITTVLPTRLRIRETPTGYLNVRQDPNIKSAILFRAKPGEIYTYTFVDVGWYQIRLLDGTSGWVFGAYVTPL